MQEPASAVSPSGTIVTEPATRNARVLIHDFDRSLQSLSSDDRIEQIFGFRPRRYIRTKTFNDVFLKTHKPVVVKHEDVLGVVEEEYYQTDPSIDVNVLDSISAYNVQLRKEIRGDATKMSLPMWGEAGDQGEDMILKFTRTNTSTIMLGHTKSEEDKELGRIRTVPAISGRLQNELGRYFGCVFFTKVTTDDKGRRSFLWQGIADERMDAKCRFKAAVKYLEAHEGCMPQDFQLLFRLINESGFSHTNILILGNIGTGKTFSLSTLKNTTFPVRKS